MSPIQKIHEDHFDSENGWIKSQIRQEFFLDPNTGSITCVATERLRCKGFEEDPILGTEVSESVLGPDEIPFAVRKKVEKILKTITEKAPR